MRRFESCRGHEQKGSARPIRVRQLWDQRHPDGQLALCRVETRLKVESCEQRPEVLVANKLPIHVQKRQSGHEGFGRLRVRDLRRLLLGGLQLALLLASEPRQVVHARPDIGRDLAARFLGFQVRDESFDPRLQARHLAAQTFDLCLSLVRLGSRRRERFPKRVHALGPEHMGAQELDDFLPCPVLA
ncbi:MAG: hypothetical protein M3454_17235 [Actinomycetota bacterium]|nr:hypothetical protein [Actinomycetota bacterium]